MKVFVTSSLTDRELVEAIISLLHEGGHEVVDTVGTVLGGSGVSRVSTSIRRADAIVAVITSSNPNVFFETGIAMGASVPTLIAAPSGELLPADLAAVPYVQLVGDSHRDAQTIARRLNELSIPSQRVTIFESAEDALRVAVREAAVLESMSPADFERLLRDLFKERGYSVEVTGSTRDVGVDFGIKSRTSRKLVLVQVKKLSRQSLVSVDAVRSLLSAVRAGGATLGMIVTTSEYTPAALAAAGSSIILRTLEDVLASESEKDLETEIPILTPKARAVELEYSGKMREEFDEVLAPARQIFWETLDGCYNVFVGHDPLYPKRLIDLVDMANPPIGLPLSATEHLREYPVKYAGELTQTDRLLYDFCRRIYPSRQSGRLLEEVSIIPRLKFDSFHLQSRGLLARFWNHWAEQLYVHKTIGLDTIMSMYPNHCRLAKILSYLEIALTLWTEDMGVGKQWLFRLARDWSRSVKSS
jgi:hypothetical protein